MKLALLVKYANGEEAPVDAVFPDFVAFERTWQRSVARFEQDLRLTDLAWLAWHAETRNKKTALKFDPEWTATVESVEVREDAPASDSPLAKTQPST